MKLSVVFLTFFLANASISQDVLYSTQSENYLTLSEMVKEFSPFGNIVLGEEHYNPVVQNGQAKIVEATVKNFKKRGKFTFCWEFLNYTDQGKIDELFQKYKRNELGGDDLIKDLFTKNKEDHFPGVDLLKLLSTSSIKKLTMAENESYLPIFKVTKDLDGEVVGVNLPRSIKRLVTRGGMDALDPKYIPEIMERGSENYYTRFKEVMQDHVPADKLENYFMTQSLTDSVMAYQMEKKSNFELRFLIVGEFHTLYNDGVVAQLEKYFTTPTFHVEVLDATRLSEEDIQNYVDGHLIYGKRADFLYFAK